MRKPLLLGVAIFSTLGCGQVASDGASSAGGSGGVASAVVEPAGTGGQSLGDSSPGNAGTGTVNGCPSPSASAGILDATFGLAGVSRVVEDPTSVSRILADLALASDGSVFVLGANDHGTVVFHLNANGALDTAFGDAGFVWGPSLENPYALTLDPNGNLLLAGDSAGSAWVQRLTPKGELDTSFGMAGRTDLQWAGSDHFVKVLVKRDGSLVAIGTLLGLLDQNGVPLPDVGSMHEWGLPGVVPIGPIAADAVEQADGAILMVGVVQETEDPPQAHPFWMKVDARGIPDSTFNRYPTPGLIDVPMQSSSAIAITTDAKGGVTGWGSNRNQLTAFDEHGTATAFSSPSVLDAHSVAIDCAGRVFAAGSKAVGGRTTAALARFQPTGALDTSFAKSGVAIWEAGEYSSFSRVRGLPDGRVLVAGVASKAFVVARYQP